MKSQTKVIDGKMEKLRVELKVEFKFRDVAC